MKKMMGNYSGKLQQLLCLLICVLMVVAVSIRRDGKVAGRYVNQQQTFSPKTEPMAVLEDGSVQLNTTELGKDIVGYGGIVPLEITLQDGRVKSIRALANSESPDFFTEASALLTKWNGKTIEDAQKMKVDAVSGATFSSKAIIGNVQRGLQYAAKNPVKTSIWSEFDFSHDKTVGRPAKLSNTTGFPVFASSARSSCCTSGISRLVRLAHSPLISAVSPMAQIITSASFAICSASFFIFTSSPQAIDLPSSPFF